MTDRFWNFVADNAGLSVAAVGCGSAILLDLALGAHAAAMVFACCTALSVGSAWDEEIRQ